MKIVFYTSVENELKWHYC